MPLNVCLVVDLVKGLTTLVVLGEDSVPPALLPLDGLLSEGSNSYLASKPLLSLDVSKLSGNLRTMLLPGVLKRLLNL